MSIALALHGRRGWVLSIIAMVLAVPLAVFFVPSINPTGLAISSVVSFGLAMSAISQPGLSTRHRVASWLVLGVSGFVAVSSRWDAAASCALIAVLMLAVRYGSKFAERSGTKHLNWRSLLSPRALLLVAGIALISLYLPQLRLVFDNIFSGLGAERSLRDFSSVLLHNIVRIPEFYSGFIAGPGWGGLGWFNTPMPLVVPFGVFVAAFLMLLQVFRTASWPARALLILLNCSIVVALLLTLQADRAIIGEEVQPRYFYPLFVASVLVFASQVQTRIPWRSILTALAISSFAHAIALSVNVRRYVTGLDVIDWNLNRNIEWWSISFSPMSTWLVGTTSFAVAMALCAEGGRRSDHGQREEGRLVQKV